MTDKTIAAGRQVAVISGPLGAGLDPVLVEAFQAMAE
jgi:hypothetical protein